MKFGTYPVANHLGALALSFLGVGLLVGSEGCGGPGGGRNYCDSTGCYQCDGYGCSSVTPPPADAGPSATNDSAANSDAGPLPDAQPDASPDTGVAACAKAGDCGSGQQCYQNQCITCGGSNGPCPCVATADCSGGDTCAGGLCTAPTNACKFTSECANGKICDNGQCVAGCDASHTCAAGLTCSKGACQPVSTAGCTANASCPSNAPLCVNGACSASCTLDTQCPHGDYCNQGACVLDTRPQPECTDTSQCGASQSCMGGYCKYNCAADAECKLIDARIGYCGADKVCRTQNEAHPQCTQKSDCANGQDCVSNLCQ